MRALGEGMFWQPSTEVERAILFTAGGLTVIVFLDWWKVVVVVGPTNEAC